MGPSTLLWLRGNSERAAITDLAGQVPEDKFNATFGAPPDQLEALLQTKTVTISKLLQVLPPGTPDPTPFIYESTFYALAGLASVAAVAQFMVRPVRKELFVKDK